MKIFIPIMQKMSYTLHLSLAISLFVFFAKDPRFLDATSNKINYDCVNNSLDCFFKHFETITNNGLLFIHAFLLPFELFIAFSYTITYSRNESIYVLSEVFLACVQDGLFLEKVVMPFLPENIFGSPFGSPRKKVTS